MDVDETVAAFETDATFDGALGHVEVRGAATDCSVTLDADGDDHRFRRPTGSSPPTHMATVDVDDADYLRYGFWLQRTTDKDGATTYNEVQTFAGSSVEAPRPIAWSMSRASATYVGGAAGVYVKNVFNSEGKIDTATSGHFTADAELNATFGQVEDDVNE